MCFLKTSMAGAHPENHTSGYLCTPSPADQALVWGVQGYATEVPAGFGYSILLAGVAGEGPIAASHKFGRVLRRYHNMKRLAPTQDKTSTRLSYWTDNGSTQYGGTKPLPHTAIFDQIFSNLSMIDVHPSTLQLDPWWYPTGDENQSGCS